MRYGRVELRKYVDGAHSSQVTVGFAIKRVGITVQYASGYPSNMVVLTYEEMDQLVQEYLDRKQDPLPNSGSEEVREPCSDS